MAGVEAAVGMQVARYVHRRSGMDLHVVIIKDGIAPEGKLLLLENTPNVRDYIAINRAES